MTKIKTKEIQTKETKQTKAKKVVVRKTFKILTVVGARPQFIKSAMFSQALDKYNKRHVEDNTILFEEILVHTGQHYDVNMSDVFFKELGMKKEKYNLGINGGSHANQTGRMMIELENVLFEEKPDLIVIFGDTNSTVVGAIVGSKLNIPIAHVESGFRSFDKTMPEEINRIIADHVSTYLFCFTTSSMRLLENEGIKNNVHYVGDITYDAVLKYSEHKSKLYNELKKELKLNTPEGDRTKQYIYCTIHRPSNTDSIDNLKSIFNALLESGKTIILPLHPRTRHMLEEYKLYNR
jgi:UDP-N-acetylglucosamine 2-epimerase